MAKAPIAALAYDSAPTGVDPYNAKGAAAILGITPYVLNERVREGWIKPMFETGDRRYSGYALAQLLGWPLADKVRHEVSPDGPEAIGVGGRQIWGRRVVCRGVSARR